MTKIHSMILRITRARFLAASFMLFISICNLNAFAADQNSVSMLGGLVQNSTIIHVRSLDDSGPSTLRDALKSCGPCLIIFDVSGVIELKDDLTIDKPNLTIVGESAPPGGIILHNGTLRVRESNVFISNISIYSGSTFDKKIAENRDGISLYGSKDKHKVLRNIVLQNVSIGWGVDENIGIQGLTNGVRIERSLIAHPLRYGGHPKGNHSMNLLLGGTTGQVLLLGNIFAGAEQRNPRLTTGVSVSMINNLIAGSGALATHLDTSQIIENTGSVDIIGNYYATSAVSDCKKAAIHFDQNFLTAIPRTQVYLSDNYINNDWKPGCLQETNGDPQKLSDQPLTAVSGWTLLPAQKVKDELLRTAGSHPLNRNPIDQSVIEEIKDGSIQPLDNDLKKSELLENIVPSVGATLLKDDVMISTKNIDRIKDSLCERFTTVTGLKNCPYKQKE